MRRFLRSFVTRSFFAGIWTGLINPSEILLWDDYIFAWKNLKRENAICKSWRWKTSADKNLKLNQFPIELARAKSKTSFPYRSIGNTIS